MMRDDRFLRVDVAIPAYNEEFRISGILQDVGRSFIHSVRLVPSAAYLRYIGRLDRSNR